MFKLFSIVFVAFFVQGALSQEILEGQCPEITPIENFDYEVFTGRYYDLERFPDFTPVLNNTRCTEGTYGVNGSTVSYAGYGIDITSGSVVNESFDAVALTGGALIIPLVENATTANLWALGTDYTNYVTLYACINVSPTQFARSGWIIVRDLDVDEKYINEARNEFKSVNINPDAFLPYDHTNCAAN